MATEHFVIVGGGLAGATAARTLRAEGFEGKLTVLCRELHYPYLRPPLSKGFLLGTEPQESVPVLPRDWYAEHQVDLWLGTAATAIDPPAHSVSLDSGTTIDYSRLLVATGSIPRRPDLPGIGLGGVLTYRTLDDCLRLKELLGAGGRRVVLVGSGWIGTELAAAARTFGNDATVLSRSGIPLVSAIGPELGSYFRTLHESRGVRFAEGTAVELQGEDGSAIGVLTSSGEVLPADVVVVAVGAVPDTRLAEEAGLDVDNGILTDAGLHTSAADVFAAGDVANAVHPFTGERHRSEHWNNALMGGKAVARSMLGQDAGLGVVPYFYTDQFDVSMEYSGFPTLVSGPPDYRGDPSGREFVAFWLREGSLVAGLTINVPKVQKAIRALILSRIQVDVERLRNPQTPLDEQLPQD
jgi:3-phenylpropionate/trans-cinnamate dioxygenase ferredoxin reductase component